jgi:hypothetical protein
MLGDRYHEPVPSTMERFNHPLFAATISNGFAGCHNATLES